MNLNGVGNAVLGGWTANAIAYLSTGIPIASPVVGAAIAYFNQRPDLTCNPAAARRTPPPPGSTTIALRFPRVHSVAGSAPAYLDHVRTMGAQDFDMSLYKNFTFGKERTCASRSPLTTSPIARSSECRTCPA